MFLKAIAVLSIDLIALFVCLFVCLLVCWFVCWNLMRGGDDVGATLPKI